MADGQRATKREKSESDDEEVAPAQSPEKRRQSGERDAKRTRRSGEGGAVVAEEEDSDEGLEDELEDEEEDEDIVEENEEDGVDGAMPGENDDEMAERMSQLRVWRPEDGLEEGQVLEYDPKYYTAMHSMSVEWPALSFDFIRDNLGEGAGRLKTPYTCYAVTGTQAGDPEANTLLVMKMSDLSGTQQEDSEDDENEDNSDVEDDPILEYRRIRHKGGVNRVRCMPQNSAIVATWSEIGEVNIWDISSSIAILENGAAADAADPEGPTSTFNGHRDEGFAINWSHVTEGRFASGANNGTLYVWEPQQGGVWAVGQNPYVGHNSSVEDIQWSPNQADVFATASSDQTIKIWDTRTHNQAMATINAHTCDVNVIAWNPLATHVMLSGADDGTFNIWDLRVMNEPQQHFAWHKAPITAVEWHPTEGSSLAVAVAANPARGAISQITLWDLAVEDDDDATDMDRGAQLAERPPPALLFEHMGQDDVKEVHWHPQITGLLMSTAHDGFNIFKPINF